MTGSASFTRSRGACSNPSPGSASTTCTNQSVLYTPYRYFRFTQTLSIKKLRMFKIIRYIRIPDATNRADGGAPYTFTSPASLVSCDRCAGGSSSTIATMLAQIIQTCSEYCENYPKIPLTRFYLKGFAGKSSARVAVTARARGTTASSTVGGQGQSEYLSDVSLYFSARKVPFELQVNFDPSGGFPQSQYNKGFKLNYFQIPC